jgi:hypothetical protein
VVQTRKRDVRRVAPDTPALGVRPRPVRPPSVRQARLPEPAFSDDGVARPLELVDVQAAPTGVLVCTYHPTGAPLVTGHSDELYEDPTRPPV